MADRYIADNYIKDVVSVGYKEINDSAHELALKDLEIFFRKVISNGVENSIDINLIEVKKLYLLLYYDLVSSFPEEYNNLLKALIEGIKYDVNIDKGKTNYLYYMNCNEFKKAIEFYESLENNLDVFVKSLKNLKDALDFFEVKYKFYVEQNNYGEDSFIEYLSANKDVVEKFILLKLKYLLYTNHYSVNDTFISYVYSTGTLIRKKIDERNNKIDLRKYSLSHD